MRHLVDGLTQHRPLKATVARSVTLSSFVLWFVAKPGSCSTVLIHSRGRIDVEQGEDSDTAPTTENCGKDFPDQVVGHFDLNVSAMGVGEFLVNPAAQNAVTLEIADSGEVDYHTVHAGFTNPNGGHNGDDIRVTFVIDVHGGRHNGDLVYNNLLTKDKIDMLNGIWSNLMHYHLSGWQVQFVPESFSISTSCPTSLPVGQENPNMTENMTEAYKSYLRYAANHTNISNTSEITGVLSLDNERPFIPALTNGPIQLAIKWALWEITGLNGMEGDSLEVEYMVNMSATFLEEGDVAEKNQPFLPHRRPPPMIMEQISNGRELVDVYFRINCTKTRTFLIMERLGDASSISLHDVLKRKLLDRDVYFTTFRVSGITAGLDVVR